MKALITGATGFIGSHLVEVLTDNNWDVRVLVRATSDTSVLETRSVEKVEGDVRDAASVRDAVKSVDTVFHTAALVGEWGDPKDFYDINVTGMKNMIEAAAAEDVARFIDISSTSVHGYEGFDKDTEDLPYRTTGILYSDTKMEAEKLVWEAHAEGRIRACTIRPCMVWGPRDRAYMTKLIFACKRRIFAYVNGGDHDAGLAHVRNVCDIILRAADNDEALGKAFIATDDSGVTFRAMVEKICDELKLPRPKMSVPLGVAKTIASASESMYRMLNSKEPPLMTRMGVGCIGNNLSFDITRAKKILGYKPIYQFPDGLNQYLDWFKMNYKFSN